MAQKKCASEQQSPSTINLTAEGCFSVREVRPRSTTRGLGGGYDTLLSSSVAIESKAELALVPTAVIAVKQTMTIKANITAYSTAVGPSSDTRNRRIFLVKLFIVSSKLSISKLRPRVKRSGNWLKRQDTEVYTGDTDKISSHKRNHFFSYSRIDEVVLPSQ